MIKAKDELISIRLENDAKSLNRLKELFRATKMFENYRLIATAIRDLRLVENGQLYYQKIQGAKDKVEKSRMNALGKFGPNFVVSVIKEFRRSSFMRQHPALMYPELQKKGGLRETR